MFKIQLHVATVIENYRNIKSYKSTNFEKSIRINGSIAHIKEKIQKKSNECDVHTVTHAPIKIISTARLVNRWETSE